MTHTYELGRLGNQIIRNLAVSLIAEKHNLYVNYCSNDLISKLGIKLFSGTNAYRDTHCLCDDNYFDIYTADTLTHGLDPNCNFFQTKAITNLLYDYLHTDIVKSNIMEANQFNSRYNTNNDLFIHIRLDDIAHHNPGIHYYLNAIFRVKHDNLYISTDSKDHDIIQTIMRLYPTANLIEYDEITTFQFASTCRHIILSHGTFSAIIGYLSFFSTVYYPEYEEGKIWHGDIFSINNWIRCSVAKED